MMLLQGLSLILTWSYALIFWLLVGAFLPPRGSWPLKLAGFLLCGWLADAIIYPEEWHSVAFTMAGFFVYLLLFHRGNLTEKISVLLLFYPALVAVNYLMTDLGSRVFFALHPGINGEMVMDSPELQFASTATHALALALRLCFWLASWALLRKSLAKCETRLTARMWLLVDVIVLASTVAIFTIICFLPAAQSFLAYPICGAAIVASFGSMVLVTTLVDHLRTAATAREALLARDHLQARLADEERVRRVYHDLKNHLLLLEQGNGTAQNAAHELRTQIAGYEDYHHTGNDALDIILRDKARQAREKQIDLNAVVHFADGAFIAPLDLSTIFGNALDNAIEAAEKLPPDERLITLKAGTSHDMLVISCENSCACAPLPERTSKDDDFLHGFGLGNIRRAVAKYDGEVSVSTADGFFRLRIIIPLQ